MSRSNLSEGSRHIPQEEHDSMATAYGGKRCILSLEQNAVQYSHIIPFESPLRDYMLEHLFNRKLCPQCLHYAQSKENLIPLRADHHNNFDNFLWTIFPPLDLLEGVVVFEEMWQEYRKYHIGLGNGDPGRPDYYFGQNMMTSYEVHWGMFAPDHVVRSSGPGQVTVYIGIRDCPGHDPPVPHQLSFPKLDLLVAIPNVVFACLPRLASFPSRIPLQQKLLRIGAYLVDLWNWDPHIPAIDGRPQYLRVAVSNGDVPQWPPPPSRVLGTPLNQDSIYGHYISPPVTPGYQLARVPMTSAFELPLPQLSPLNSLARTQHPTCMPLTPPESPTKNHLDISLHENQLVPHSMLPMPPGPLHYASSAMSMSHSHALFMSRTLSTSPVHLAASFLGNESVSTNDKNTSQISREETFARIQTWRKAVVDCDTKVSSIEETVPERSFGRHTTANDILFMIGVMKGSSWLKGLSVPVT